MRKVCFFGVAASQLEKLQLAEEIPEDAEIWVVNEGHRYLPENRKPSRVFQLHVRQWRETERRYLNDANRPTGHWFPPLPEGLDPNCFGRNEAHVDYLRTCGVPVYGQQVWSDIPTSVCYPFEAVMESVGIALPPEGRKRLWATSSFGYMAALLLHEHSAAERASKVLRYDEWSSDNRVYSLQLIGIELPLGSQRERLWEWPNFAYYLGLLTGLGIELRLPSCGTSLLSAPHYALDGHPFPLEADHWWAPGFAGPATDIDGTIYLGTRLDGDLL